MTNFLFGGFLPDQSTRLALPRAAMEAPHRLERGREGQEDPRGTRPRGLTAASCCGVWSESGLTSILSAAPASSSAILRETDARSGRPPAGETSGNLWPVPETRDDTFTTAPEFAFDAESNGGFRSPSRKQASRPVGREGFPSLISQWSRSVPDGLTSRFGARSCCPYEVENKFRVMKFLPL